jgi:hypothetical protein
MFARVQRLALIACCAASCACGGGSQSAHSPSACESPSPELVAARIRSAHGSSEPSAGNFTQTYFFEASESPRVARGTVLLARRAASWKYLNGNVLRCTRDSVAVSSGPPGAAAYERPADGTDCGVLLAFLDGYPSRELDLAATGCANDAMYVLTATYDVGARGCRTLLLFVDAKTYRIRTVILAGAGPENRLDIAWKSTHPAE